MWHTEHLVVHSMDFRHSHDEPHTFVLGRTMFLILLTTYGHNPTFNSSPVPAVCFKHLFMK